jgi:hypothetical protein
VLTSNLPGVIFALCAIWLFVIKWMLLPKREKLPLSVQAGFLLCLGLIWIMVIRWYENRPVRYPPDWWIHVVYFFIPLPIGVLGCRCLWCFYSAGSEKSWLTQLCFQVCIFLAAAALLSVLATLMLSTQKVREAANFAVETGPRGLFPYFTPTTIESGPLRCSTRVCLKPAWRIQAAQSAPV